MIYEKSLYYIIKIEVTIAQTVFHLGTCLHTFVRFYLCICSANQFIHSFYYHKLLGNILILMRSQLKLVKQWFACQIFKLLSLFDWFDQNRNCTLQTSALQLFLIIKKHFMDHSSKNKNKKKTKYQFHFISHFTSESMDAASQFNPFVCDFRLITACSHWTKSVINRAEIKNFVIYSQYIVNAKLSFTRIAQFNLRIESDD